MPVMHRSSTPVPDPLARRLQETVGAEHLITEPGRLTAYESDALTSVRGRPRAVVFPGTEGETAEVVRLLHDADVPFVPRGSGTGLAGGAIARDAVLVATVRLNRILELDPVNRRAVVEPGVVTDEISAAAAAHGLRYLPDPASGSTCTVGGNVATNAGGPHCLRDGVTTDHVLGLHVVLPDGSLVDLDRGDDGGLDLAGLFVGSEGTLGIVTRIRVRLAPRAPAVGTALALFDDVGTAGAAVSRIMGAGLLPVALELVDRNTIRIVEESEFAAGLPTDAGAALIVESEGLEEEVESEIERVRATLEASGARSVVVAREEGRRKQLWQARKKAYGALGRLAPDVLVQDAAVPRSSLPDLLPEIERVAEEHDVALANFFHAGDGNVHPNLLFDRRDAEQLRRVEEASAEIMELCVAAGGTITGEHGVGLDKREYMSLIFSERELAAQRRLKLAVDPGELCNADKMLPREEREGDGSGPTAGSMHA